MSAPSPHGRAPADGVHPGAAAPPAGAFLTRLDDARELARHEGRPLFVHFTAPWCEPCQAMKRDLYPRPAVRERLARFVRAEVDVDADPGRAAWMEQRLTGLPTLAFFRADGTEARDLWLYGAQDEDALVAALDRALAALGAPPPPARERAARTPGDGIPGAPRGPAWWPWLPGAGAVAALVVWAVARLRRRGGASSPP